jgi:hypothetical protein
MLTSLTQEQQDQIPRYLKEYIGIGSDTSPMDREKAREAVLEMYTHAGFPHPKRILYCTNPVLAAQAGNEMAKKMDGQGGLNLFSVASCASGAARFAFLVEVCGVKIDVEDRRQTLEKFIRSCGSVYPHSEFAIIVDRPSVLKLVDRNGTGVLHCEDGPAIAWGRDADGNYDPNDRFGYAMFYWNGTRVPGHWIMDKVDGTDKEKAKARAAEILSETNQEVLRAGCEIVGWVPVLEALGMRVLDENPNPIFGRLVEVDLPDAPNTKFLVAQCGTGRTIAVLAHAESTSALDAGARSYGVPVTVYEKLKVRT